MVSLQWVREFRYVYAALGPQEGTLQWRIEDSMKTEALGRFLEQVSNAHPDRHVLLVMDQARSHKARDLAVPPNISLEVFASLFPGVESGGNFLARTPGEILYQPGLRFP